MDNKDKLKELQEKYNTDLSMEIWTAAYKVLKDRYPRFNEFEPNDLFCPFDVADDILEWAELQQQYLDEEEE